MDTRTAGGVTRRTITACGVVFVLSVALDQIDQTMSIPEAIILGLVLFVYMELLAFRRRIDAIASGQTTR